MLWQGMVAAWELAQGPLDQYGMQHTRAFANLCNSGVTPEAFKISVFDTTPASVYAEVRAARAAADCRRARAQAAATAAAKEAEQAAAGVMEAEKPAVGAPDDKALISLEDVARMQGAVVTNQPGGLPTISFRPTPPFAGIVNLVGSVRAAVGI